MEGALSGSQYNRAWRIHHNISETLEWLIFRRFKNEVASHVSNEVFNIVCENENLITDEETKILPELATDYENQETNVRGIISRLDSFMK